MKLEMKNLRTLVCIILCNAQQFEWEVQGLGMLRMRVLPDLRLHIWHSSLRVQHVSDIHDHLQWHLRSTIVCGHIRNQRFRGPFAHGRAEQAYWESRIKAGVGGGLEGDRREVFLHSCDVENYTAGQDYTQAAHEIHRTEATDGTVTLMQQTRTHDIDGATVFWQGGENDWVSAVPRKATQNEIAHVTQYALAMLTGGRVPVQHHAI